MSSKSLSKVVIDTFLARFFSKILVPRIDSIEINLGTKETQTLNSEYVPYDVDQKHL